MKKNNIKRPISQVKISPEIRVCPTRNPASLSAPACLPVGRHGRRAGPPAVGQGRTGFRLTLKQMQYFSK